MRPLILFASALAAANAWAQCVPLESLDTPYAQNFDSLAASGSSASLPAGWTFVEAGVNANGAYTADTGASNSGDTYSYGAAGSADRAFGTLRSGSLTSTIGACFVNRTGKTITRFSIAYVGKQFRLGSLNRRDSLDFQYRVDASSLNQTTGWSASADLSFPAPVTGPAVGAVTGQTERSASLTIAVPDGSALWIRWLDIDATGADDGLAVDDFRLTPSAPIGLSVADVSVDEGDSGSVTATVPITLDTAAGGPVIFDLTVSAVTATPGADFTPPAPRRVTIPAGATRFDVEIVVTSDREFEPDEIVFVEASNITGAVAVKPRGTLTIVGDDAGRIGQVQGAGAESPYVGRTVLVEGVVTARKSNGFFLQSAAGADDADPATSDGVFVFTGAAFAFDTAPVGAGLRVRGAVTEFRPAADPTSPPLTELTQPVIVGASASRVAMPEPVTITEPAERFEGMRVRVASLVATAPSGGTLTERDASASSNGVFHGVAAWTPRPYREPGIDINDPLPTTGACCIPRWDGNPEILRVDSRGQQGASPVDAASGAVFTGVTGVLDFGFRAYTILPDPGSLTAPAPPPAAIPLPAPDPAQFTVASFNLQRFFDTTDDPGVADVVLTRDAFERRLAKASLAIRDVLRSPDIIGVQEAENSTALQAIADRVNADSGAANPRYTAHLVEGNDPGGIDVGFLVKTARVRVDGVTQEGKSATFIDPRTNQPETLNDRPPLVLRAAVEGLPVTIIVNHLRSLTDLETVDDGPRIRAKRQAQADRLAALVQARQAADPGERIVVIGDFNAFPFNDGYSDVVNTVRGTQGPAAHVASWSADSVDPDLVDAGAGVPSSERYSYVFGGSIQTLDQVLFNAPLRSRFAGLRYAHLNADFPESLRNDATRPERISDHDVPVATFWLAPPPISPSLSAFNQPVAGRTMAYEFVVANSGAQAVTALPVTMALPAQGRPSLILPEGWSCDARFQCSVTIPANSTQRAFVWFAVAPETVHGAELEASVSAAGTTARHHSLVSAP